MDAFEQIIAGLLWEEGFWTSIGYKVNLSKARKVELGKPSYPRPEIDILAYKANENRLLWVECKSFLDSRGIVADHLMQEDDAGKGLYKAFTWPSYRRIVTEELIKQVCREGRARENPTVKYCLVTGNIATQRDREKLHQFFEAKGWILYDECWIKSRLELHARKGYENDVAIIVAKLFDRIHNEIES
jgi:hypothetical protein